MWKASFATTSDFRDILKQEQLKWNNLKSTELSNFHRVFKKLEKEC